MQIRGVFKDINQVFIGVQAVFNGGLNNAEHNGATLGAPWRVTEKEVFPVMFSRT
jgi:hypothetical protein